MLQALSAATRRPQWAIVDEAIRALVDRLPEREHEAIAASRGRRALRQFRMPDE
jgi:hypothetical protein